MPVFVVSNHLLNTCRGSAADDVVMCELYVVSCHQTDPAGERRRRRTSDDLEIEHRTLTAVAEGTGHP